jgi:heat shock protein HtpX
MTAVLAHEMGHILNGDSRLLALAAEFSQLIRESVAVLGLQAIGAGARRGPAPPWAALLLVLIVTAPFVGAALQHGLSRAREYDADRIAAGLLGHPLWLVGALRTLHEEHANGRDASVFDTVGALLRSHPDTCERIGRLIALPGRASSDLS